MTSNDLTCPECVGSGEDGGVTCPYCGGSGHDIEICPCDDCVSLRASRAEARH